MKQKPNILFILSDQHNAKLLGHKGHADVKTPFLDQFAKEGVACENAITQNPICTPSRTCFLSGQYAHNHGIYQLYGPSPQGLPNLLGHCRNQGYTTAAIGKIHCPAYWVEDQADYFDETCGACSVGGSPRYDEHIKKNNLRDDYLFSEARPSPAGGGQCLDGFCSPLPFRSTPEGYIVDQGKAFMKQADAEGKPFCVHLSFPRPHQTYAPTKEFWDLYDENEIQLPPNWNWDMKHKAPHLVQMRQKTIDTAGVWTIDEPRTYEGGCRRKMRGYLGNISMVDHAFGEVLAFLKENGLEDNTIVVYSSDHGDYACEQGIIEKAPGICSDAITRIPMIWRAPGKMQAGHVVKPIVESVDVVPTLLDLCGLPALGTADGKSITDLLTGSEKEVHRIGVTEFAWSKSVRKGDFRYVYYPNKMFEEEYPDGFGELYNLKDDPWEMNNLWFDENHKPKVQEMERELMDWLVTSTRVVGTLSAPMPEGPQVIERNNIRTYSDGKIHPDALTKVESKNYL